MKRPVTSLCRRPGKKDRLRGSLSPVWEQFPPIETLCGGQAELPGKSRPNEGAKTALGEAGGCVQAAPMGEWRAMGCLVPGKHRTGCPPGQRACPGAKTVSGGGRELCADCAHGRAAGNGGVWFWEGTALGTRWDRGARPGAKTAPGGGAGDCAQTAPMGERRAMGVSGAGKHHTGHPVGQRACPGAKTAPGGAGGCLDAGYGCYLPRAIRVIWMHRVGSTARPRIMPS